MRLDELAGRLEAAGDELAGASTTMSLIDPGARTFGADAPGGLGELGRQLHGLLATALTARGHEAATHGARLADAAQAVRQAARAYEDAERQARDQHQGGAA